MAKIIRSFIIAFFLGFLTWAEDLLIFIGLGFMVVTTYFITELEINILAGNYLLGFILLVMGLLLAKK